VDRQLRIARLIQTTMKPLLSLTLMLAGLAMIGPFSIDTYLPSFGAIAVEFHVATTLVQQTLSIYLLCFAGMMLFHGTLSDAFGRRPVILVSLVVYTLASLGATFAPSLGWLIAFRALQGLSAGAGTVVGRAMIRDRVSGAPAQKLLSDVTIVFAVAPAIAPVLGGWLQVGFGWRAVFGFLTIIGLLLGAACWFALPESLPASQRQPFHPRAILRNYCTALRHPGFLLLVFAMGSASIGFFAYVASAPHFVIEVLRLSETSFAWLFLPLITGMVSGAVLAGRLAHRWTPQRLLTVGYLLMAFAAVLNLGYNLLFPAQVPWAVLPLGIYTFGLSLASPSGTVMILNVFPHMRGLAASLQAFVQTFLFALVSAIVAPLVGGSALRLALFLVACITCSAACLLVFKGIARRRHSAEP
jgi:MFS transporter, DHA1 family, multidrug resistance protein